MYPARLHAREIARHRRKVAGLSGANGAKPRCDERSLFQPVDLASAYSRGRRAQIAYEAVQRAAMRTWKGAGTFAENAKQEPEITTWLSDSDIERLCSLDIHFKHIDATFRALGLD